MHFDEVKMIPAKENGVLTYALSLPSIYKKRSLTTRLQLPLWFFTCLPGLAGVNTI